jgi:hypothetical protein
VVFEAGLFTYLSGYAGLAALVGTRIYPLLLPQDPTLPAVTYQRISTPRLFAFEHSFLPHATFQFDCWASDFSDAKDVAEQVRLAMDVYRGAMGAETVQACIVEDERDTYEAEPQIWHSMVSVQIWYEE